MKFLINAYRQKIFAICLSVVLLTSCSVSSLNGPARPTSNPTGIPQSIMPSQTRDIRPLIVISSTSTSTPLPWPSGTTNGYYIIYYYTSIRYDVFEFYQQEKMCIISIAFGQGLWAASLDRHTVCANQKILVGQEFPEFDIEQAFADKYYVSSLAYGDGQWTIILSRNEAITAQKIETYPTFSLGDTLTMQTNGYWVTNIAYGNGIWVVIFTKTNQVPSQSITTSSTFPQAYLDQNAKDGMFLTAQTYGENMWVIILSKMAILGQDIRSLSFFSKDIVRGFWEDDKHYYAINLFYGENRWFAIGHKENP